MKNAMIKIVDAIILLVVILAVVIAGFAGAKAGGAVQGIMFAIAAFVLCAFGTAFWFCISGIYHHTKAVAEAMK